MNVAELTATLRAEVGSFFRNLEMADAATANVRRSLESLEKTSKDASRALNDVKMQTGQAAQTQAEAMRIRDSLERIAAAASEAARQVHDVGFSTGQATRFAAETEVMHAALDRLGDQADATKRKIDGITIRELAPNLLNAGVTNRQYIPGFSRQFVAGQGGAPGNSMMLWRDAQQNLLLNDRVIGSNASAWEGWAQRVSGSWRRTIRILDDHNHNNPFTSAGAPGFGEFARGQATIFANSVDRVERDSGRLKRALSGIFGGRGGGGGGSTAVGGGDYHDYGYGFFSGLLPGGRRASAGATTTALGLGIAVAPELLAGAAGLGATGASMITSLAGAYGTLKLALSGISSQAFTNKQAFDALSKSQQALVQTLRSLDAGLGQTLRTIAQNTVLPAFVQALHSAFSPSTTQTIVRGVQAFSGAIAAAARAWGDFIGSKGFSQQFGILLQNSAKWFKDMATNAIPLADALLRITNSAAPFVNWMDKLSGSLLQQADAWTKSTQGQKDLAHFWEMAKSGLKDVADVVGALFNALSAVFKVTDGGTPIMRALAGILNEIARVLNQNRAVLHDFFEGAVGAVRDLLGVVRPLETVLHKVLDALDGIAKAVGGWKTVIEAGMTIWVAKWALGLGAVTKVTDAIGGIAPALAKAAAAVEGSGLLGALAKLGGAATAIIAALAFPSGAGTSSSGGSGGSFPTGGSASAAALQGVLKGSPLSGFGGDFARIGAQYGVNPALLVAIAGAETQFGATGTGQMPYHNPFGLKSSSGGFAQFKTWDQAIAAAAKNVSGLISKYKPQSIADLARIYVNGPNSRASTPMDWVNNVTRVLNALGVNATGGAGEHGALVPGATVAPGAYVNPLSGISGYQLQRIDQGRDISTGKAGLPVAAIGDAVVTAINKNSQGFGQYIAYRLLSGPQQGRNIYVGHANVAPGLRVGSTLAAGQTVAITGHPSGSTGPLGWLEMGFANPRNPLLPLAQAGGLGPDHNNTPAGRAFSTFLSSLIATGVSPQAARAVAASMATGAAGHSAGASSAFGTPGAFATTPQLIPMNLQIAAARASAFGTPQQQVSAIRAERVAIHGKLGSLTGQDLLDALNTYQSLGDELDGLIRQINGPAKDRAAKAAAAAKAARLAMQRAIQEGERGVPTLPTGIQGLAKSLGIDPALLTGLSASEYGHDLDALNRQLGLPGRQSAAQFRAAHASAMAQARIATAGDSDIGRYTQQELLGWAMEGATQAHPTLVRLKAKQAAEDVKQALDEAAKATQGDATFKKTWDLNEWIQNAIVGNTAAEDKIKAQAKKAAEDAAKAAAKAAQDALAKQERATLGMTGDDTATVITLRAQAKKVGTLFTNLAPNVTDLIDQEGLRKQIDAINKVLAYGFVPPDVRAEISTRLSTINDTVTQAMDQVKANLQAQLESVRSQFEQAFSNISSAADQAFQDATDATLQGMQDQTDQVVNGMQQQMQQAVRNMQIMVTGPNGGFLFGGGITQTPAEQQLQALQDAHDEAQRQAALTDAQTAMAAAKKMGDPALIKQAQQQLDDAKYAITVANLQKQADAQQQAAHDQLQAAQDAYTQQMQAQISAYQRQQEEAASHYQRMRQIEQTAMDQQVQAIVTAMENGELSADEGLKKLEEIWKQHGVDGNALAFALGGQMYIGLAAGLKPVFDLLNQLLALMRAVQLIGPGPSIPGPGGGGGGGNGGLGLAVPPGANVPINVNVNPGSGYIPSAVTHGGGMGGPQGFATGGWVSANPPFGHIIRAGEQEDELIIPKSKLGGLGGGSTSQTIELHVYLDGKEIAVNTRKQLLRKGLQVGPANLWTR